MKAGSRIMWLDIVKLFAIFLVVLGHCYQQFDVDYKESPMFLTIYAFHMPLFMMVSGYLLDYEGMALGWMRGGKLLKKRIYQLIIPSIIWIAVIWCTELAIGMNHLPLSRSLWFRLWFLKSLFACTLLLVATGLLFRFKPLALAISLIISQLSVFVPHLWFLQLNIMYPSLVAGMFVKVLFSKSAKQTSLISIFATMVFVLLLLSFNKDKLFPNMFVMLSPQWPAQYGVLLYKLVIGLSGAMAVIGWMKLIFEQVKSRKLQTVSVFGRFTLEIYILQTLMLETLISQYLRIDPERYGTYVHLIYFILAVVIILCCVGLTMKLAHFGLGWTFNFNKIKSLCLRCR